MAVGKLGSHCRLACFPEAMSLQMVILIPCQRRHGIMLVGPAGAGKTAIAESLAAALTELGTKHVLWRMNPKVARQAHECHTSAASVAARAAWAEQASCLPQSQPRLQACTTIAVRC